MSESRIEGFDEISQVLWADAELESVEITYDCVAIEILEPNGKMTLVRCLGYVGYESIGVWDEMIIEKALIHESHEIIDRRLTAIRNKLGEHPPNTGCDYRNKGTWNLLRIVFIDGGELNVVTAKLSLTDIS